MSISDLVAGGGLFICAQAGGRWIYSMIHGRRQAADDRAPRGPLPQEALRLADSHPYRALRDADGPDAAQLALNLADEAVRRERARMNTIARAVIAGMTPGYGRAEVQAIIDAIGGGA